MATSFPEQQIEMGAHQCAHVERREPLEQAVPHDREQRGRDQQLRKARQRIIRQLTAHPPRGSATRAMPAARARSPRGSRTRQAWESACPSVMISRITSLRRVPKISRTNRSTIISATARAGRSRDRRGLDGAHQRAQHRAHKFLEQALLVAEVEIDRALGDAGAARDVVEPGRRKAARPRTRRAPQPGSPRAARPGGARARRAARLLWRCGSRLAAGAWLIVDARARPIQKFD